MYIYKKADEKYIAKKKINKREQNQKNTKTTNEFLSFK